MNLRELLNDEDAVSPVIGVILMVAITVILAAVIGTFVLGLGDQVQTTAPNAQFSFDFNDGSTEDILTITHEGGQGINAGEVAVMGDVSNPGTFAETVDGYDASSSVRAGTDVTVRSSAEGDQYHWDASDGDNGIAPEDAEVRVVWQDADSDQSSTLRTWSRN
ncbi:type IV pilin N-terminal domain-containing protein [Natronomonas salina]|uniref:type IV pilin n=1 Tax=Natronomonas salina TaxID=1710540 RepID=UPI0015B4FD54|nr:type IV pilin N-terminal domain-containing protein [Natronomonas salina]QLD90768.1 type IV pilin N-terminal domain-containing protein [Natronomonas salina]